MSAPNKSCERCGVVFDKDNRLDWKQWAARRYCGQTCTGLAATALNAAKRGSIRDLFNAKVVLTEECWEWSGTIDGYGYGVLDYNRRRYRAHVLALEFDGRPVSDGQIACHHCDNPRCVRASHLYAGTPADNAKDASSRDRIAFGMRNRNAKLTPDQVREMREMDLSFSEVARKFGVSRPTATRAIKGETWRRVS